MESLSQTLITGVYRSGTEYVAQLISGHPELSTTMYHVNALRFIWNKYDPIAAPENWCRAIADTAKRLLERYEISLNAADVEARCRRATEISYGVLYDALMSSLWLNDERRHWAEKCQLLWREAKTFLSSMPNGRVVMVIRDPRSVLASFKKYTYAPPPAYLGAVLNCFDAMKTALRLIENHPDRVRIVRYETAALDPRSTARELYGFLNLDPDRADDDARRWRDHLGNPWIANTAFIDGGVGFDVRASIERWKGGLEPWEIALTEDVVGTLMAEFGYERLGLPFEWREAYKHILVDSRIAHQFGQWLDRGLGIEAFPTDPLDPAHWEENQIAPG